MNPCWRVMTPCPSCGLPLTTDGTHVWCASYGPPGSPTCVWGLRMDQPYYKGMLRLPAEAGTVVGDDGDEWSED